MSDTVYWIWLSRLKGMSPARAAAALTACPDPADLWRMGPQEAVLEGVPAAAADAAVDKDLDAAKRIAERCWELDITVLTRTDTRYPRRLLELRDAPAVLYSKGTAFGREAVIAVVGSRNCSEYASRAATKLSADLAKGGACVASGFARGVDTQAAWGCLSTGGAAIGILGCGIDVVYPPENAELYEKAFENGLVLSEYPPGTTPQARYFPVRNRLISGLALGVVVVEAGENSGSMITASLAKKQGRDLFAVPADLSRKGAAGSVRLLKEGARLVTCAEDVLGLYRADFPDELSGPVRNDNLILQGEEISAIAPQRRPGAPRQAPVSEKEIDNTAVSDYIGLKEKADVSEYDSRRIVQTLLDNPSDADGLTRKLGIPVRRVMNAITVLELEGKVRSGPGGVYSLI